MKRRLKKFGESGSETVEKKKIQKEIKAIAEKVSKAKLDKLFVSAYHELFADLVAVIKMKDPDAMKKLISKTTKGNDGSHRSFQTKLSPSGWTHQTPHYVFAPTRSYLGQNQLQGLGKEGQILKDVFDAIAIQLQKTRQNLLKQYQEDPQKLLYEYKVSAESMNTELIALLKNLKVRK